MKLYVSDLDGTLLNSNQQLSNITINIVNKLIEGGLNFSIATARSLESAGRIISPLNLKLPIILHNGVFIYDPVKKQYMVSNFMDNYIVKKILAICDEMKVYPFIFTRNARIENKAYYKGIFNYGQEHYINSRLRLKDERFVLVDDLSQCMEQNVINIVLIGDDKELQPVYKVLKDKYDVNFHYTVDIYSKAYWLEITNKNANKKEAVKQLKNILKAEKLVCFGDNLNDSPMFEAADEKYAVENAHELLKKMATSVIGSNNNDGVARYLESVIEKNDIA